LQGCENHTGLWIAKETVGFALFLDIGIKALYYCAQLLEKESVIELIGLRF
jgi:hypothetical protein